MTQPSDAPLKLIALDAEDLAVLSAHLQDTTLKVRDLVYLPGERRFAFVGDRLNRLCDPTSRRRAAAHFDRVTAVRARGVDRTTPDAELELLVVAFTPKEEPSGVIELHFAGGACLQLEVECVEAQAADLGPATPAALPSIKD
ncbi:DUF2948 family protein [Methylopila musalis]|uniref:DUF2948 family protein n=1 Tax=Methylopila musalis TaxID=1134781 RepID=A0ABW3Z7Y8_9HYPH